MKDFVEIIYKRFLALKVILFVIIKINESNGLLKSSNKILEASYHSSQKRT
jgi:hypothetical protein